MAHSRTIEERARALSEEARTHAARSPRWSRRSISTVRLRWSCQRKTGIKESRKKKKRWCRREECKKIRIRKIQLGFEKRRKARLERKMTTASSR